MQKITFREVANFYIGCMVLTPGATMVYTLDTVADNGHCTFRDLQGNSTHLSKWVPALRRIGQMPIDEALEHVNLVWETLFNKQFKFADFDKVELNKFSEDWMQVSIYPTDPKSTTVYTLNIKPHEVVFNDNKKNNIYITHQALHFRLLHKQQYDLYNLIENREVWLQKK